MNTTIDTIVKGLLAALKIKVFFVFAGMAVFSNTIRNNTISGYCEVDPWRVGGEYGVEPYSAIYIGDFEQIDITGNTIQNPGPYGQGDIIVGKYADKESIRVQH